MRLGETSYDENKYGPRYILKNNMDVKWALQIDDLRYGDQDVTEGMGAKLAIIDSGNSTI